MDERQSFDGFLPPVSNTTYTPNQFFDVVLRRGSRGAVRLVSYLIRKTLGWCDSEGCPRESQITVSYRELETHAGLGHSSIAAAVQECLDARYINIVRQGRPDAREEPARSTCYELRWDARDTYVTDPLEFDGFFSGNGNLTYIPNQFFDELVPNESLSVIRIVGAIIRRTIGFQTRYGFRRREVKLSHGALQRYSGLSHEAVRLALQEARSRNYVVCIEQGVFDPDGGHRSRPATLGIRWRDGWDGRSVATVEACGSPDKASAADRSERRSDLTPPLRNLARQRSEILHGERSGMLHGKEITENNTLKQQQAVKTRESPNIVPQAGASVAVAGLEPSLSLLLGEGFDDDTARDLAGRFPPDRVARQCEWLSRRGPRRNRVGLLRRAIEGDWPEPPPAEESQSPASRLASGFYSAQNGSREASRTASGQDLASAASLLERVAAAGLEVAEPMGWGTQFAIHVRRRTRNGRFTSGSLAAAVAAHGDDFVSASEKRREEALRREITVAQRKHQAEQQSAYLAYLSARANGIREQHPDAYRLFETSESERRLELQTGFVARVGLTCRMMEHFDREEERLCRFQAFFADHTEHPVLDFWGWDERHNPQALRAAAWNAGENVL